MSDPIRAIVRTVTSECDRNGNCYHIAQVYSVRKGIYNYLTIETGGKSNIGSLVGRILGNHAAVLMIDETIPKRQWQAKRYNLTCLFEHEAEIPLRAFFGVKS